MTIRGKGMGEGNLARAGETNEASLIYSGTVVLTGDDPQAKRLEIRDYFHKTFSLYERLFDCLADEQAYLTKATPLRHPLIFYYGHTAVFFVNKLHVAKLIPERLDPEFESMLAIGVDEMSWDDLNDAHYNWPSTAQVKAYRDKVRRLVDDFIMSAPLTLPIQWDDPFWIVMMGIEHERIHLETSSVLIRQLPIENVRSDGLFPVCDLSDSVFPENNLVSIQGRPVTLGKSYDDRLYGWDNEYGAQSVNVENFQASQYLVSNGEFLAFVKDGGYAKSQFWTEEGQGWLAFTGATHPEFWVPDGDSYRYRCMTEIIAMPWNWPVDVNQLEAKAFCNWLAATSGKSIRLPTEAEWSCLRSYLESDLPDWQSAPGNINLEHWASACPVDQFGTDVEGQMIYDIVGNVWQWTETPIEGFQGFRVHPVYDDFSTPTFDGQHNLIKGGSFISTGNYAIRDSRYAFRRHFFQHAGFRYIESDAAVTIDSNPYETDALVSQYLEFHYGEAFFGVPNFAKACADICISEAVKLGITGDNLRALDMGCAVGRSSFELARHFKHVDALDFSARFISAAVELQKNKIKRYVIQDEGELVSFREITLQQLGLTDDITQRCLFMQGDACNLNEKFTGYDLIFAGNLIDRLYSPRIFLEMVSQRLRPGGLLILASPYTWLEEFTEKTEWLGGFKDEVGENRSTLDGLHAELDAKFETIGEPRDVPFVIRETRRKFQHTLSQLTVWRLRG